ncbi:MAG: CheR family methyltransferase [Bacteroidales bacterium]
MNSTLTIGELSGIAKMVNLRLGLDMPPERYSGLKNSLKPASAEFGYKNLKEFVNWLLTAPLNKDQLEILAAHLTINETYFWREPSVFEALEKYILPDLLHQAAVEKKLLRIWSAGCSTGEEPYSIAIALHRITGPKDQEIKIYATDIDTKALSTARTGIYGSWSFRNTPEWLKSTYFRRVGDQKYEIVPFIKKMVSFHSCNLTDTECSPASQANVTMDIIFCRNVLMYFTREWARKISDKLTQSLSKSGWLAVSSCELSSGLLPELTPVNFPGAVLFRKLPAKAAHNFIQTTKTPVILNQPVLLRKFKPVKTAPSEVRPDNKSKVDSNPALQNHKDIVTKIRSLAGKGELTQALSACNKTISGHKLDAGLYFLRASILQEMNENREAIRSLKQAVYIEPNHIMGHFNLGSLYFREGKIKSAERHFRNALELLNGWAENDIPEGSEGLAASRIRDIVMVNLNKPEFK